MSFTHALQLITLHITGFLPDPGQGLDAGTGHSVTKIPAFFSCTHVLFSCVILSQLSSFRIVPSVEKAPVLLFRVTPPSHPPVPAVVLTLASARDGVGWTWCTFPALQNLQVGHVLLWLEEAFAPQSLSLIFPSFILSVCFLSLHYRIS